MEPLFYRNPTAYLIFYRNCGDIPFSIESEPVEVGNVYFQKAVTAGIRTLDHL